MANPIPAFLLEPPSPPPPLRRRAWTSRAIDKGLAHLAGVIQDSYIQWDTAARKGLLQALPPAAKVILWFLGLVAVSVLSSPLTQSAVAAFLFFLTLASEVRWREVYPRVMAISLLFGLVIPLPSLLIRPEGLEFRDGLLRIGLLFTRNFNSLTLTFLLLWTTPYPKLLRGLQSLNIPEPILWVLSLTRQYLFLFARTVQDMHMAKKSRQITRGGAGDLRGWEVQRIADLWDMTRKRCDDVAAAIQSRTLSTIAPRREISR